MRDFDFKTFVFAMASLIYGIVLYSVSEAALTGPSAARPGELARFDSDTEADWQVLPVEHQSGIYIDSNKKSLIISSPKEGTIYIFAATVGEQGVPVATVSELIISNNGDIIVTPLPPVPPVDQSINSIVQAGIANATAAEKQALANSFSIVCQGLDNKTIKTATGARETFRKQWLIESSRAGAGTAEKYAPLLDALSAILQSEDITIIRTQYAEVVKSLGYTITSGGAK
jgi:hypothetical protein